MQATTQGLGPFYPKIVEPDGEVWVHSRGYKNEDGAHAFALQIVERAQALAHELFDKIGFVAS